jgi:acetyl-CoA acetyltransferase
MLANEDAMRENDITPLARVVGFATAGVEPRVMGIGPVPATQKLLARENVPIGDIGVIELNEAFAAQALAVTRALGIEDGDSRVNPNGGAIALGHPLGMSGARLAFTAATELTLTQEKYALVTMCIGVGQGIAMLLQRV